MRISQFFFIAAFFLFGQQTLAQRNYDSYNRLGITAGYTLFDIQTSDFETIQQGGITGGFTTRGSFWNSVDLIFGLNFSNNALKVKGTNLLETQDIPYTIQAAQLTFLGSFNIVKHHLSLEVGPIFNVNGRMKLDSDRYQDYIVSYNTIRAQDIQDISMFNVHLAGGITTGIEDFRVSALYQYGVTNVLQKLNDQDLGYTTFEGNSSTLVFSAVFYF